MVALVTNPDADVLKVASALGFGGFFCLAAAVVWGMVVAVGPMASRVSHETLELGHLAWSVAGLTLVTGHVLAHTLRPAGAYTWVEALVPFARGGIGVALGVAGWLALVSAAASFVVRHRLGAHRWTVIHRAAYVGFALMAGHVVVAADDVHRLTWLGITAAGAIVVVGALGVIRWRSASSPLPIDSPQGPAVRGLDP